MAELHSSQPDERAADDEPVAVRADAACLDYSALLTACFDGEADAAQAAQARAHLETCALCGQLWQAWTRQRALLRSLPRESAPSFLPAQIRAICRLSALLPAGTPVAAQKDEGLILNAALLPAPAPPAFLKDEILRCTTGAAIEALLQGAELHAPSPHTGLAFWETTRRALAAVALPAAALCVILLSQRAPDSVETPMPEYSAPAPSQNRAARAESVTPKAATPPKTATMAALARVAPPVALPSPAASSPVSVVVPAPARVPAPIRVPARSTVAHSATAPERAISHFAAVSFEPPHPARDVVAAAPRPTARVRAVVQHTAKRSSPRAPALSTLPRVTLASWRPANLSRTSAPVLERANYVGERPPVVTHPLVSQPIRVATSLPDDAEATDDDSDVLTLVSRARDNRPDDVREAVDDFRALLASASRGD
jgi:hypothetical protein